MVKLSLLQTGSQGYIETTNRLLWVHFNLVSLKPMNKRGFYMKNKQMKLDNWLKMNALPLNFV